MELLEREHDLQVLVTALEQAIAGRGRVVLVSGEAGIGKSSLVEHFIQTHGQTVRILKGNCDALFTPTPLGPLYDIARQIGGKLSAQLESNASRAAIFFTLLDQLCDSPQPTLLAIEDIHWADETTLDLTKVLSRRVSQMKVLLIVTYRDDDIGVQHKLRAMLGDMLTSNATVRIELSRLTVEAARIMIADRLFDPQALHRQTSGNPFFISEIISSGAPGIPKTVRDAVLARVVKLEPAGRKVLEAAAVLGSKIEHRMLERLVGGGEVEGLAECMKIGLIVEAGDCVAFRHELMREAVLTDLDPGCRRQLNQLALEALKSSTHRRSDLAQLAHYAEGAGNAEAVLEHGLAAAQAASSFGAHREAAAQYVRVLRYVSNQPLVDRAQLLEAYAEECVNFDELTQAIDARREAIELWRTAGDRVKEGQNLALLAWPLIRSGQIAAAEDSSRRAIEVLESIPPTRELAAAYRIQAHLRMLKRESAVAIRLGAKAMALATRFHDDATMAAAENIVGSARLVSGDEKGRFNLYRSLRLARHAGLDGLAVHAYSNLGSCYGEQYRFTDAERHLSEGITYARERDLDHANNYMHSWLALTRFYQGCWSEASDIAIALVGNPAAAATRTMGCRIMALVALGRVRARRGDPGATAALDEALELATQTGLLQRLAPARAARAEAAWLAGERERVIAEARAVYELAIKLQHRWHAGEFSYWRWLGGDQISPPEWSARPFFLQIKGNWRGAAGMWKRIGCPYEQARALADGDPPAQMAALEIFTKLGAAPAAAALRQRMRREGVRRVPRGPRTSTRQNPFGLTVREMEILSCLANGLSNRRIGAKLHISPKTVDHHVSAVLAKLGAASRGAASRIAREQHLIGEK